MTPAPLRLKKDQDRRLLAGHCWIYSNEVDIAATPLAGLTPGQSVSVRSARGRWLGYGYVNPHSLIAVRLVSRERARPPGPALWVARIQQALALRQRLYPQPFYRLIHVEGDLLPMAEAFGLGVTPWSPLKGGILTGKYTRDKHPEQGEGRYKEDSRYLTETTYKIVDALTAIGKEVGATPAQVALAWVIARPGVTSTIIGARKLEHLDANLAALDVELTEGQIAKLDELSKPNLNFPHDFLDGVKAAIQNGTTVNGDTRDPWPLSPEGDKDRY